MSAARTVRRPKEAACILDEATRSVTGGLLATWKFGIVVGSFTGGWTGVVAVALSEGQQAALVCRLAAQRRASCAWRAEPRPRARAPPMATRQVTARARAWRSESHRIAEVLCFVYDDFQSVTVGLCPQPTLSLYTTLFQTHRRPVPSLSHVTQLTSSGTRLPVAVLLRQLWKFCFMACCSATRRNHHALEMRLPLLSCVARGCIRCGLAVPAALYTP